MRIDQSKADPHYVYWWLQGMYAEGRTWAYQNRSTGIANFQFQHFLDAEVVRLPRREEQRAIAATLGAIDDKIESNRRATAAGESLVRTIVESALDASEGEDGVLGDYCALVKSQVKVEAIDPAANYIGLEYMPRGSIFLNRWGKAEGLGSNKTAFRRGDLLFGKLRPYFKKVGIAPIDGVCSTDILAVRPKNPRDIALVAAVAASDALIDALSAGSTGTRMPRASWKDLAAWRVPVLTTAERIELSARVDPLVERLTQLTFESHRLAALRDALMPELLSGRLRVPVGTS
ncbi:restriction endonuclease subunit S [Kocuria varians]|nr:restriction endonuclease subunit S [Kocuria varians]